MRGHTACALTLLGSLAAFAQAQAPAGTLTGSFNAAGMLPENARFRAVLVKGANVASSQDVALEDGALQFSFGGMAPARYRARLVAVRDGRELVLAATDEVELTAAAPSREGLTANAPGKDGSIAGTLKISGTAPKGKLIYISARRVDVTLKSPMPDEVDNASFEIADEDQKADEVEYHFTGLSYGIFKVQLMSYDYKTHETAVHGVLREDVVLHLDRRAAEDRNFTGSFAARP